MRLDGTNNAAMTNEHRHDEIVSVIVIKTGSTVLGEAGID